MDNDNMHIIGSNVAHGISSTEPFEGKGGGTFMSKILIIEDDLSIGEMMSIYLYEEGYQVMRAETGRQGEVLFRDFEPDIIVLDIMLPDVDGIQLCTDFRNSSTIPILMVSAKNEVSDRVKGLQTGADDYLCKPFSMRELSARIQALLRRSQRLSSASSIYRDERASRSIWI